MEASELSFPLLQLLAMSQVACPLLAEVLGMRVRTEVPTVHTAHMAILQRRNETWCLRTLRLGLFIPIAYPSH